MKNMEQYKEIVKKNIEELINNNSLKEAKNIIREYEEIVPDDKDVYSFKAIIAMMEEKFEVALMILKEGLDKNSEDFNLNYNLAYLYESQQIYTKAYKYYEKAVEFSNIDIRNYIREKINGLEQYKEKLNFELQPPKITIVTMAYNVKKYIGQCIKSVLNQSLKDFEWVVLDNGCTDGTSEILKEYAKKDSRIKLYKNEKNSFIYKEPHNFNYIDHINNFKSEYVCYLDSDDYLHKDFLKELYMIAKENNTDIAACGVEMFNDENPQVKEIRNPPNFNTKNINEVGDIFPQIYRSLRPMWGKLIRASIAMEGRKKFVINRVNMINGGDTMFSFFYLELSDSIVSLGKELYYYRIRESSTYYSDINKERYLDYIKIYFKSNEILKQWNKLDNDNFYFIANVLYFSIKDCIDVAVNALNASIEDRIEVITTIISDNNVRKILNDSGILLKLIDDAIEGLETISENERKLKNI